jgi:hypothetical protein
LLICYQSIRQGPGQARQRGRGVEASRPLLPSEGRGSTAQHIEEWSAEGQSQVAEVALSFCSLRAKGYKTRETCRTASSRTTGGCHSPQLRLLELLPNINPSPRVTTTATTRTTPPHAMAAQAPSASVPYPSREFPFPSHLIVPSNPSIPSDPPWFILAHPHPQASRHWLSIFPLCMFIPCPQPQP